MPKKASKKAEELKSRPKPLRGEDAAVLIDAKHAQTRARQELQVQAKKGAAARQNIKAESVVEGNKAQHRRAQQARKENIETDMAAHAERYEGALKERSAKGLAEIEKVKEAVESLHEAERDARGIDARAQDDAMIAAAERRARRLSETQAKGHAETEKVEAALAKLQDEAAAKAAKIEADHAATAERRASRLSETQARAAAESEKVERAQLWGSPALPATPLKLGLERPTSPSTDLQQPRTRMRLHLRPMDASPPPAAHKPTSLAVAQTSGLMLQLMRGGAPNAELLRASTVEDYLALGQKYGIPMQGPTPLPMSVQ